MWPTHDCACYNGFYVGKSRAYCVWATNLKLLFVVYCVKLSENITFGAKIFTCDIFCHIIEQRLTFLGVGNRSQASQLLFLSVMSD